MPKGTMWRFMTGYPTLLRCGVVDFESV